MKRALDVSLVLVTAPLTLPIFLVTAILVRLSLGPPIFFVQKRPGLGGHPFAMLKFRTMTQARDGAGKLLPDAMRLTQFGRLLRATSLDELPELINVLRGEMSLVGPRPLLLDYLPLYSDEQRRRHEVLPGITGWAQINGRNQVGWEEKFALDVWYVDNRSLWLDIKILFVTVVKILAREGIAAEGEATMKRFTGDAKGHPSDSCEHRLP